jgi:hypothetical protein
LAGPVANRICSDILSSARCRSEHMSVTGHQIRCPALEASKHRMRPSQTRAHRLTLDEAVSIAAPRRSRIAHARGARSFILQDIFQLSIQGYLAHRRPISGCPPTARIRSSQAHPRLDGETDTARPTRRHRAHLQRPPPGLWHPRPHPLFDPSATVVTDGEAKPAPRNDQTPAPRRASSNNEAG